jgi:CRP-like cAMP-binding protein
MEGNHFLLNIFTKELFKEEELNSIIPLFKKVKFYKDDYLLREGKVENLYWFLEQGYARSYVTDSKGNDITTEFYSRGDVVIDWPSFFLRSPTREYIQALTDCECWQLDFETFQKLLHSIETFREQGRTRLVQSYFSSKNHRITIIADQAKERYLQLLKARPHIIQNIQLKHIATFLGITNYSLSRIRREISE